MIIWDKIKTGEMIDKTVCKKNIGWISWLYFRAEQQRQNSYIENGPLLSIDEASMIYQMMVEWLEYMRF